MIKFNKNKTVTFNIYSIILISNLFIASEIKPDSMTMKTQNLSSKPRSNSTSSIDMHNITALSKVKSSSENNLSIANRNINFKNKTLAERRGILIKNLDLNIHEKNLIPIDVRRGAGVSILNIKNSTLSIKKNKSLSKRRNVNLRISIPKYN